MVQSVHLSSIVVAVIIATMVGVLGQFPDYFDPVRAIQAPPRRRQTNNGQSELYRNNPYLSKLFNGNWFRTNFQDLFSYKGAQKLEWFEVLETAEDCNKIPEVVNAGRPPRDICVDAAVDERRCICIKTGRGQLRSETGYERICGNCRDPCQLKFTPDLVPAGIQQLAANNADF